MVTSQGEARDILSLSWRMMEKPDVSPAQPCQLLHPPALSLPRQPLHPGTRLAPNKAAASEEARRYGPHFVKPFAHKMDLAEWKIPSSVSGLQKTIFHVEPLSDARTKLTGFFSILLRQPGPLRKRGSLPDSLPFSIHNIPDEGVLDEKTASC